MARRTYDDVASYVLTRTGNRSEATAALREQWINDALLRVAFKFRHPEMQGIASETLSSGDDYLTPAATDIFAPVTVKRVGGQIIHPMDHIEEIEAIATKPSGYPSRYYWWAGSFRFDRTADADYTIKLWYRKSPARWSSGNAPLAEAYDFIIESYALHNALNFFREYEKAQLASGQADQYARDMQLPLFDARRADWNAGIQVRMR